MLAEENGEDNFLSCGFPPSLMHVSHLLLLWKASLSFILPDSRECPLMYNCLLWPRLQQVDSAHSLPILFSASARAFLQSSCTRTSEIKACVVSCIPPLSAVRVKCLRCAFLSPFAPCQPCLSPSGYEKASPLVA